MITWCAYDFTCFYTQYQLEALTTITYIIQQKAMIPVLFTQKVKHTNLFTLPLQITLKISWSITQSCRGNWKMQEQQSYSCKAHEFHVHMHQNWEMQFLSAEESSDLPHYPPHQVLWKFFINSQGVPPFTNVTSCLRLFCSSIEK